MTTSIVIALFEGVTMLDAIGPYSVLCDVPESEISFAAEKAGPVSDSRGRMSVLAHGAYDEFESADVVVIPGGLATVKMAAGGEHPIIDWIRKVHPTTQYTTSVCTGSQLLGAAGLLDGLSATGHWFLRGGLGEYGAIPCDDRIVEEGKIITAAGVSSGIDMGLLLIARLRGDMVAQAIQLGIEYDPDPPFNAGSPSTAPEAVVQLVSEGFARALER